MTLLIDQQYRSYWECLADSVKSNWKDPPKDEGTGSKQGEVALKPSVIIDVSNSSSIQTGESESDEHDKKYQIYFKRNIQENWIYAHTLFQSQDFHSAHVGEIEYLARLLNELVVRDRLPSKESLEGLRVLKSAWDVIDIGNINLRAYKSLSKFIYLFMLVSGIATVSLTVLSEYIDSSMNDFDASMTPTGSLIFYLSIASTFATALNTFLNPSGRWRQIRDTTCHLESAIWLYRTRTGPFKVQKPNEVDRAASVLKNEVSSAVETLLGSSDIGQSTSWGKLYSESVFKHGQLPRQKSPGILFWSKKYWNAVITVFKQTKIAPEQQADDHYSPLTPEKYIQFRLKIMVGFYKNRLPIYTRSRNLMSIIMMIVTAVGTILAYKQYSDYVSICATVAAAITSWMEYNNIATKIGRYNSTVSSLESLILLWESIPEVEKGVISKIDNLINTGEQVLLAYW